MSDLENQLVIDVKDGGKIHIDLMPDLAPKHVERIKELTRSGFYDGRPFQVIEGFMAQTGCPRGDGTAGSDHKLGSRVQRLPIRPRCSGHGPRAASEQRQQPILHHV